MNNIIKLILIVCLSFGAYTWNKTNNFGHENNWISYSFVKEKINVKFPENPKIEINSAMGINIKLARIKKFENEYIVGLTTGGDFSQNKLYPYSLEKKGASIKSNKIISVDGFIGREFHMYFKGKEAIQRFIKYNGILVTQLAIYKKENKQKGEIDKFFKSLNINKKG
jgi:hypothetical protein